LSNGTCNSHQNEATKEVILDYCTIWAVQRTVIFFCDNPRKLVTCTRILYSGFLLFLTT